MVTVRTSEELREHWNSFSSLYEKNFLESTTVIYQLMVPLITLSNATKIVEAGCGTGNGIKILRQHISDDIEIYGNDLSDEMLNKAKLQNYQNAHLILANNEILPYEDMFCDRYIANLSLQIVENPVSMINESFRVLQHGGIAVFSV